MIILAPCSQARPLKKKEKRIDYVVCQPWQCLFIFIILTYPSHFHIWPGHREWKTLAEEEALGHSVHSYYLFEVNICSLIFTPLESCNFQLTLVKVECLNMGSIKKCIKVVNTVVKHYLLVFCISGATRKHQNDWEKLWIIFFFKRLWLIHSCTGTVLYKSSFIGSVGAYVILFHFFAKINLSAVIWCKVYNMSLIKLL